jgi:hypothetical protein
MTAAVIGGTYTVGPFVVSSCSRGADVRSWPATPTGPGRSFGHEPGIRQADIGDHDQVIAGCAGADSVLLLTSHAHNMTDLQLRIIRMLRPTGIKIVKVSGISSAVHPDGPARAR